MKTFREHAQAICLMVLLAIGTALVLGFVLIGGGDWLKTAWQSRTQDAQTTFYEYIELTGEGQPVIKHGQWTPIQKNTYYDLDRHAIPEPDLAAYGRFTSLPLESDMEPELLRQPRVADRVISLAGGVRGNEQWFLVADSSDGRQIHFEGYDGVSHRRVGEIGASGFTERQVAEDDGFTTNAMAISRYSANRFPGGENRAYVWQGGRVTMIDFGRRSVQELVDGTLSLAQIDDPGPRGSIQLGERLAARLPDRVQVYDELGQLTTTFPIPPALQPLDILFVDQEEEALLIGRTPQSELPRTAAGWHDFDWPHVVARVTAEGDVLSEQSVTLRSQRGLNTADDSILAVGVPALVWVLGPNAAMNAAISVDRGQSASFGSGYLEALRDLWLPLSVVLLVTGLCVWLLYRNERDHGRRPHWSSVVFVIILGLPGYIGYRLHRTWPRRGEAPAVHSTGAEIFA